MAAVVDADRLRHFQRGLVQLINLSDDDQLRDWLIGDGT
jgi:hypothetical protein